VVLDQIGYYQITQFDEIQDLLKSYLEHNLVLFVGCGSGLEDPNFTALLKWIAERHINLPNYHCLLVREDDEIEYDPLISLKYGSRHENLAPYVARLADDAALVSAVIWSVHLSASRK
jgi:hypothetical protein